MDLPLAQLSRAVPLSPLERVLKHLVMVYLRGSCTQEEMSALIKSQLKDQPRQRAFACSLLLDQVPKTLSDAEFIPRKARVSMLLHARYTPAVLHCHNFFEVLYVCRGSCINVFENSLHRLQAGELLFIPPGLQHAISVFDDDTNVVNFMIRADALSYDFAGMMDSGDEIAQFFGQARHPGVPQVLHIATDERIGSLVERIYLETCESGPQFRDRLLESYFQILMVYLLRDYTDRIHLQSVQVTAQAIDIVLQHLRAEPDTITLSDLAYRLGYSYEHLSRMIKSATGKNFSTLRREFRLQRAANLLRSTNRSVEEIAQSCGYETRSQFYAQFKAVYGVTPAQYRSNVQNGTMLFT